VGSEPHLRHHITLLLYRMSVCKANQLAYFLSRLDIAAIKKKATLQKVCRHEEFVAHDLIHLVVWKVVVFEGLAEQSHLGHF